MPAHRYLHRISIVLFIAGWAASLRQESRVARLKQALVLQRFNEFDVPKITEAVSMGREQALQQNVEQVGLKRKSRTLGH
jgi:hypothetical protein